MVSLLSFLTLHETVFHINGRKGAVIILAITRYQSATVNENLSCFYFSVSPIHCCLAAVKLAFNTVILVRCILFYNTTCTVPFNVWLTLTVNKNI